MTTAFDFQQHFGRTVCFSRANCIGQPEIAVRKKSIGFAVKVFKDNQKTMKVEAKIQYMRSTQETKGYLAETSNIGL